MTDNLRDRIAKALFRNGFENLKWEDESEELREVLRGEADAVIAELGLRVETRRRSYGRWILPTVDRIQRRWVTDWKVGNDE